MEDTHGTAPSEVVARRIASAENSSVYGLYREVRERVLRMKDTDAAREGEPSQYWQTELLWFEYMLDAGPLIVDRLRWHTHHVTGVKPYDYREHKDATGLAMKLEALLREARDTSDPDLFVPEHPALGGFGFRDDQDRIFNVDTLKYFEALIALQRGAVLPTFRELDGDRKLVWEIGAGWGGFAYQFKTLCPNTTYVIVDLPELFLFSAVYLQTVFPDARMRFYTEVDDSELFVGWQNLDFVFIPHTRLDLVSPPRCDLALNIVSFQEMSTLQVRNYVNHAADLQVPFLYSLNRERSLYNPELKGVSTLLAERFWVHEIDVLPVSYVRTLAKLPPPRAQRAKGRMKELAKKAAETKKTGSAAKRTADYRHLIGWLRLRPDRARAPRSPES
jgi:putative sugar O-methyltransferase